MNKRSLRDLPPQALDGKRALVRVDFNVPLKNGKVSDDTRLRASLPTIAYLREKGARVVLLSHLGRPKGGPDPQYSLTQIVRDLEGLLGAPVEFIPDPVSGVSATRRLPRGAVALVENTRFWPGEETNDPELAKTFAALGDLYVNDAFGSAHRAHASTEAVAHLLKPAVAGFLMEKELKYLGELLTNPKRPFIAVLGGAKTQSGKKMIIPRGAVIAPSLERASEHKSVSADSIPKGWAVYDIDETTQHDFRARLLRAKTIFWNGPMGVFETPPFDAGTRAIANALVDAGKKGAVTVVGGGDSVAAVAGMEDKLTHVSTGGGASLEFLEGKELPGVAALENA